MSVVATATEGVDVDIEALAADAQRMLDGVGEEWELSLLVCDDTFIQPLNAQWRGKDAATDVLSFPQLETETPGQLPSGQGHLLGDIVISLQTATRQATQLGHTTEAELRVLVAHGLCHLMGYTHANAADRAVMQAEEVRLLAAAGTEMPSLVERNS